jgi:hypothetical protein
MRWKARGKRQLGNRVNTANVILSAARPFACEWTGGVEGPLAAPERPEIEEFFVKFHGESAKQIGVLRLRGCFAARSSHFAQDDNVQFFTRPLQLEGMP